MKAEICLVVQLLVHEVDPKSVRYFVIVVHGRRFSCTFIHFISGLDSVPWQVGEDSWVIEINLCRRGVGLCVFGFG